MNKKSTKVYSAKPSRSPQWLAGYVAGLYGVDTINSHFSNFATPEKTKEWESGYQAGKDDRNDPEQPNIRKTTSRNSPSAPNSSNH